MRFILLAGILMTSTAIAGNIQRDHRKLDWFEAADESTQPIKKPADWESRRAATLSAMQQVMGELPDRSALGPPRVEVRETVARDGYSRDTVWIDTLFGERVPAYIYTPAGEVPSTKRPAIVVLQSTAPEGKSILDEIVKRPNRAYATELAERGFVVIAPDYPTFGEQSGWTLAASKYASGTMKAVCDNLRCVDALLARADVDPKRVAVIGFSLGGHNALFTAAFDTRISAAVTVCGWTPFHDYYGGKKLENWAQDRYMPRVRDVFHNEPDQMPFDFAEVIAAIAPRAVFSVSPLHDANFEVDGVKRASVEIASLYKRLGVPERYAVSHPDCEHDFPRDAREAAYRFIE